MCGGPERWFPVLQSGANQGHSNLDWFPKVWEREDALRSACQRQRITGRRWFLEAGEAAKHEESKWVEKRVKTS